MARNDCAMTASSGHAQFNSARPLDGAVAESITQSGRKIRRQDMRGGDFKQALRHCNHNKRMRGGKKTGQTVFSGCECRFLIRPYTKNRIIPSSMAASLLTPSLPPPGPHSPGPAGLLPVYPPGRDLISPKLRSAPPPPAPGSARRGSPPGETAPPPPRWPR